jgi:hypothetical protein
VDQRLNGHAFVSTQGNTGRCDYYDLAGDLRQKATSNTFLGFAKSPNEIFVGSIDGTELPQGLDQLESQGAFRIFRYLFQIMETGEAMVDSGATTFPVRSNSVFVVISNPIGYSVDSTKSFWALIEHLSPNPALGRRFGLVLFGIDDKEMKIQLSAADMQEWRDVFTFLRSVEEYARPRIREIYSSPEIWSWANETITVEEKTTYTDKGEALIRDIETEELKDFLTHHVKNSTTHIRGAALSASILDNLKDIAVGRVDLEKIKTDADKYLKQIVLVNLESIGNMVKTLVETKVSLVGQAFDALPKYLKVIVSAVELFRREHQDKPMSEINLKQVGYSPAG